MSTYTLRPESWVASVVPDGVTPGSGTTFFNFNLATNGPYSVSGSGDGGLVLRAEGEGGEITGTFDVGQTMYQFYSLLRDDLPVGTIPITAVQVRFRVKGIGIGLNVFAPNAPIALSETYNPPGASAGFFTITSGTLSGAYSWLETNALTINPATGAAWERRDFFQNPADNADGFGGWIVGVATFDGNPATGVETFGLDAFEVVINPAAATWWHNPTSGHYRYQATSPGEPFIASDAPVPTITSFRPRST